MTRKIKATPLLVAKIAEYNRARAARLRWEQEESDLKSEVLDLLGYEGDDPKPESTIAEDDEGQTVFEVKRGTWRGLNQKYLKQHHPDIYAECESSKATLTIKAEGV